MNKFGIGYQYFSGMYTALFPMIPAILVVTTILRDERRAVVLTSGAPFIPAAEEATAQPYQIIDSEE